MKVELDVEVPDGFEVTGEYRWPLLDEWHISPRDRKAIQAIHGINGDRIIIRRKLNPRDWWPEWLLAERITLEINGGIDMRGNSGLSAYWHDESSLLDLSWIPEHLRRSGMTIQNPWKAEQQ